MEDFGYQKYHETIKLARLIKRTLITGAAIASIGIFSIVTVKGYQMLQEPKNSKKEITTIKSPKGPIKVFAKEKSEKQGMKLDLAVYEDIFGNKKKKETIIVQSPKAAIPPKIIFEEKKQAKPQTTESQTPTKPKPQSIIVTQNTKSTVNQDLLSKSKDKSLLENPPKATSSKTKSNKHLKVQVAAMTSQDSAEKYWRTLKKKYPTLFSRLKHYIKKADLGPRGIFYRLQIGNFKTREKAEDFCNKYIVKAVKTRSDCIVIKK